MSRFVLVFILLMGAPGLQADLSAQDSIVLEEITDWIRENDPKTDLKYLQQTGKYWQVTHALSSGHDVHGNLEIFIWRDHFFDPAGKWIETRTSINSNDCSVLGEEICQSVERLREAYKKKYLSPITASFKLIQMPAYSWFEIPNLHSMVLFDLYGNFLEERNLN